VKKQKPKKQESEPRKIDRFHHDDLHFFDNRTKLLLYSLPFEMERDFERLSKSLIGSQTDQAQTPLEVVLREFEEEARKKLEENGLDSEDLTESWAGLFDVEDFGPLRRILHDDYPALGSSGERCMNFKTLPTFPFVPTGYGTTLKMAMPSKPQWTC